MDIAAISQLIGSMGFPIAMCIILVFYIKSEQDTMRETLNELKMAIQSLTEEIRDLQRRELERCNGGGYDDLR